MPKLTATTLLNRLLGRGKLRHLQVLLQLAELGSVQRTAQAIGLTQSAVTQNLAYMENLLETPLFIRHARGVMPTPACRELLPTVRQLMAGVAQGAEVLAAAHQQGRQTLRLLASASATHGLLMHCMSDFVTAHPDIRLELSDAEGDDLLLAVSRQETDLVVCRQPAVIPADWEFVTLMPDRFVVVAAPDDPLARQGPLAWDQLQDRCWLLSSVQSQARQRFESLCSDWPRAPDYFQVVTRVLPMAAHLIRRHQLLGFMPYSFVRPLFDQGQLCPLALGEDLSMAPIGQMTPAVGMRDSAAQFSRFLASRVGSA